MDSAEINSRLKDRAEEVVMHLFPAAKIKGNIAHVGGLDGERGDSFQIHIGGPRCGLFVDFAHPEVKGASLLWLWSKTRGVTYSVAVEEAKRWLGIADTDYGMSKNKPAKHYAAPEKKGLRSSEPNSKVMDYLVMERKLDPITIAANSISETSDGEAVVFPYIDEKTKKACHIKYLKVDRIDGKKVMWASKDTKRCLFGKQTISEDSPFIIICEGEIDKLSWQSLGFPCVSVPMGVKDVEWIDLDWEWLDRFETIFLSMDNDGPGEEAVAVLVKRLGVHRCRIVKLPHKDMNKCLQEGMRALEAQQCLDAAKAIELAEIQSPTAYSDKVWKIFNPAEGEEGYETPWWPKLPFRIRPAEFTVLSGYDGAGKTAAINNMILRLIQQGAKVLDCSLEIKPERTLQWMAKQALCKRKPANVEELSAVLDWLSGGVWLFDYVGTANMDRMFEAMLYAVKRHGVDVIFIDSLFKCGIGSDDYNGQKDFMARICDFCRDTGVHVFLVAHSRKPPVNTGGRNEDRVPSKDEISGSSDIKNAAFNILIIWRNKAKHQKMDELRAKPNLDLEAYRKIEEQPDGRIKLDKNRMEGIEREVCLWYHMDSTQFTASREEIPQPYFRQKL